MKRIFSILLLLLIVVLFVLSVTNPGRAQYIEWIHHEALDQSSNILEKGILSLAGKQVFDMATTDHDYIIFSVYKTDFSEIGREELTTVGVFKHFIPITKKK